MSDPQDFLSRWSRRKRAVEESEHKPADQPAAETSTPSEPVVLENATQNREEAEFDLSTLPSLKSITSGTDVSAFLRKGVPLDLSRAALRRAWSADPTIRDFIGLAENAWDFNDPNAMHGFGPLDQTPEEVRQMVAQLMGEVRRVVEPVLQSEDNTQSSEIAPDTGREDPTNTCVSSIEEQSERDDGLAAPQEHDEGAADIAAQQTHADPEPAGRAMRRAHGGAMPK